MISNWKSILDQVLVINLFIIIYAALLFISGIICNLNGFSQPLIIFEKLWLPLFLPCISLFFTAILIQQTYIFIQNSKSKDN